jgi:DNA-directed RNA polymerase specialized sigma24 family protein
LREVGGDDSDFVRAIYPSLLRRAHHLVGEQDATDLVQETLARWLRRRADGPAPIHTRAYLRATLRNLAINRATRVRDPLDQAASIEMTPWLV